VGGPLGILKGELYGLHKLGHETNAGTRNRRTKGGTMRADMSTEESSCDTTGGIILSSLSPPMPRGKKVSLEARQRTYKVGLRSEEQGDCKGEIRGGKGNGRTCRGRGGFPSYERGLRVNEQTKLGEQSMTANSDRFDPSGIRGGMAHNSQKEAAAARCDRGMGKSRQREAAI